MNTKIWMMLFVMVAACSNGMEMTPDTGDLPPDSSVVVDAAPQDGEMSDVDSGVQADAGPSEDGGADAGVPDAMGEDAGTDAGEPLGEGDAGPSDAGSDASEDGGGVDPADGGSSDGGGEGTDGGGSDGGTQPPARVTPVKITNQSCALDAGGAVWCWKNERFVGLVFYYAGQAIDVEGRCAVRSDRILVCYDNQTFEEEVVESSAGPIMVDGIAEGSISYRGCAYSNDGTEWCWDNGGLAVPVNVPGVAHHMSMGTYRSEDVVPCVTTDQGSYCWGFTDDSGTRVTAVTRMSDSMAKFYAGPAEYTGFCRVRHNGTIECQGQNNNCAYYKWESPRTTPGYLWTMYASLSEGGVFMVSDRPGLQSACGIGQFGADEGKVVCYGGYNADSPKCEARVLFDSSVDVQQLAGNCAIADGTVQCWSGATGTPAPIGW